MFGKTKKEMRKLYLATRIKEGLEIYRDVVQSLGVEKAVAEMMVPQLKVARALINMMMEELETLDPENAPKGRLTI